MRLNTAFYSYAFFAFFIFNALALLSSEFMPIFTQLFTLLAEDGRVYDIFSCILLCVAIITLCSMPLRIYKQRAILGKTAPFIITCTALVLLFLLCVILYHLLCKIFAKHSLDFLFSDEVVAPNWQSYYTSLEFLISFGCWFFLIILPLVYKTVSLTINIGHRVGKSMLILEPSITTVLIIMSANAYHPYFSNLPSIYFNFTCFIISNTLLLYVLLRNKKIFGFYDYINVVLLAVSIFCFVLCSGNMLRGTFFNAQLTLYVLGICSWCSEWLCNNEILQEKITS